MDNLSHKGAMLCAVLAYMLWSVGDALAKLAGQAQVPFLQIIALTTFSSAVTVFVYSAYKKNIKALKPRRVGLEIFRSLLLLGSFSAGVTAFIHLPLVNVYVVIFTLPMLIALFAALLMGEAVPLKQGLAIMAGFGGVLIALDPAHIDFSGGALIGYVALPIFVVFGVSGTLMLRFMGRSETYESLAFFPMFVRAALLFLPMAMTFEPMDAVQSFYVLMQGFLNGIGVLLMAAAIKKIQVAVTSQFMYTQIVMAGALGYFIWHDTITPHLALGALIIIAAGIYGARLPQRVAPEAKIGEFQRESTG